MNLPASVVIKHQTLPTMLQSWYTTLYDLHICNQYFIKTHINGKIVEEVQYFCPVQGAI
jgi:hypothetical protein